MWHTHTEAKNYYQLIRGKNFSFFTAPLKFLLTTTDMQKVETPHNFFSVKCYNSINRCC